MDECRVCGSPRIFVAEKNKMACHDCHCRWYVSVTEAGRVIKDIPLAAHVGRLLYDADRY